jgi:phosphopantothenoylcysteine decarboxylase/phosphopantothenate--cysteine ligase
MFTGKHILLGVTGGIAAYKSCELIRALVKMNAEVKVVMTAAAGEFIAPLTFETLTEHPVSVDPFENRTVHIDLARWADCVLVCPATLNTIGKIANGIADNLLTTLISATTVPVIICPAMNVEMYRNPLFKSNVKKLVDNQYHFVDPGQGELACGEHGWGRLAEMKDIIDTLKRVLLGTQDLSGTRVTVTAGPTRESIDPVRMLTNHSSGKMGFALAGAAALRGADVTLISGPTELEAMNGISCVSVESAQQMHDAVFDQWEDTDVLIMAAAVSDYRPSQVSAHKIKKKDDQSRLILELERTADILHEAGMKKGKRLLVGFALETENGVENARKKMARKNLDYIVLNNALEEGAGFRSDSNRVTILSKRGAELLELPSMSKQAVAEKIIDMLIDRVASV